MRGGTPIIEIGRVSSSKKHRAWRSTCFTSILYRIGVEYGRRCTNGVKTSPAFFSGRLDCPVID